MHWTIRYKFDSLRYHKLRHSKMSIFVFIFKKNILIKVHFLKIKILSRGTIVHAESVDGNNQQSFTFSVPLTDKMAPNARIVTYCVRTDGEVVTDSISFNVAGVFQNRVYKFYSFFFKLNYWNKYLSNICKVLRKTRISAWSILRMTFTQKETKFH